jgi:hypothetical protein
MDEKRYNAEDQINFYGLKSFVYACLQEFFRFISFTKLVVRKKTWYLIIGAIVGIALALVYYYNKSQSYKASMTVIFNRLTAKAYGQVLEDLNSLLSSGEKSRLAEQLKIPGDLAAQLIYIEGKDMYGRPLITDTSSKIYLLFRINLGLAQNVPVDTLQTALLDYFSSLPYIKKMRDVEVQNLQQRLKSIDSDLAKLDTLKSEFNRFLATSKVSSTIYNNAIDPAAIYEQTTKLNTQREHAQRMLYVEQNPVSLIDGFKVVKAKRSEPLLVLMLFLGSVGLFTGLLFGLLLETKEYVLPRQTL